MTGWLLRGLVGVVVVLLALTFFLHDLTARNRTIKPAAFRLPPQLEAPDSELRPAGEYRQTGRIVRLVADAAAAFQRMQEAARADGVEIIPVSGFRNRSYQRVLYRNAVKKYGRHQRWVAPPGYSPHHTGRALDLGDAAAPRCDVQQCFRKTPAYEWLLAHGGRFGFQVMVSVSRPGKITEPWHWHYTDSYTPKESLASVEAPAGAGEAQR